MRNSTAFMANCADGFLRLRKRISSKARDSGSLKGMAWHPRASRRNNGWSFLNKKRYDEPQRYELAYLL